MKSLFLMIGLVLTGAVQAKCYQIVDTVTEVGPVSLKKAANKICVDDQPSLGTNYAVRFYRGDESLGLFTAPNVVRLRCPCEGGQYQLKFGADETRWLNAVRGTWVIVWMENQYGPETGKLTISPPHGEAKTYQLRQL